MRQSCKGKLSYSLLALSLLAMSSTLVLNGCQSNIDEIATKTHGSKAGDGYTYGTGPNKTKPYPQSEPVNINNVGGAKPKNEPYSRGGNKDYTVLGQHYMVWNEYNSYQEVGTASWYGPGFHGNKTSNGEVYDQRGFSAAHKNLPLPSYVKVTNLENGRAVIVRVNDRGPFHGSRIIDLSEGAAKAIDMTKKGTAKVKLELIDVRHGQSNIANTTASGQKPIIGIINNVFEKNTSSETRKNLENLSNYQNQVNSGNKPDANTTIAAIGSTIYFADKVLDSIESTPSTNQATSDTTIKRTITTTTTTVDESGEVLTDKNIDITNIDKTTGSVNNNQYEVSYVSPPPSSTSSNTSTITTTTTTNSSVNPNNHYAATTVIVESGTPFIQFFSSSSHANARKVQSQVKSLTKYPVIIVSENGLFRVRIGPLSNQELSTELEHIKQLGYKDAFIKRVE